MSYMCRSICVCLCPGDASTNWQRQVKSKHLGGASYANLYIYIFFINIIIVIFSSSSSASSLLINPPPLLRAGSGRDLNKYICIFAQAVYLYAQTVVCACAQYMDVISCDVCVCDAPMLLFTIFFFFTSIWNAFLLCRFRCVLRIRFFKSSEIVFFKISDIRFSNV